MRKFISIIDALNESRAQLPEAIRGALNVAEVEVTRAEMYGAGKWDVEGILAGKPVELRFITWDRTPNFDYMLTACSEDFTDEAWQKVQQTLRKTPLGEARLSDPEFNSYTDAGEYKTEEELTALAYRILPKLTSEQRAAMQAMEGGASWKYAIPIRTNWQVKIQLERLGLSTGMPRSGDNGETMTPLGKVVRDMLDATDAKMDLASERVTISEEKPTPPMKPGEEGMAREVKQQQRQAKAAPAPQPPKGPQDNVANGQRKPEIDATDDNAQEAPLDKEAQQALDTVDDGIEAGEEAKKILKQAGVIESLIRESVEGMFKN